MLEIDIKKNIIDFLTKLGLLFDDVEVSVSDDLNSYSVSIKTKESNNLILGRDGEVLQSINHLFKRFLDNKHKDKEIKVFIDINDFHKSKIEKIKTLAYMMAERARFFKSKVELDPMNAFERRIIHDFISKHDDLVSESTGFGKTRRVVISFKNNQN